MPGHAIAGASLKASTSKMTLDKVGPWQDYWGEGGGRDCETFLLMANAL